MKDMGPFVEELILWEEKLVCFRGSDESDPRIFAGFNVFCRLQPNHSHRVRMIRFFTLLALLLHRQENKIVKDVAGRISFSFSSFSQSVNRVWKQERRMKKTCVRPRANSDRVFSDKTPRGSEKILLCEKKKEQNGQEHPWRKRMNCRMNELQNE